MRLVTLLLLLLYCTFTQAQNIDSLRSDEQVQTFVRKVDRANFFLKAPKPDYGSDWDSTSFSRYPTTPWQRADFDNNGHIDLLVNGYADADESNSYCDRKSLVILSFGNDSFAIKELTPPRKVLFFNARPITINRQSFIEVFRVRLATEREGRPLVEMKDTLTYAFDEFIEVKPVADYGIEQIMYSYTDGGFWPSSSFKLLIRGDSILFEPDDWSDHFSHDTLWTVKLTPPLKAKIYGLLNQAHFPAMEERYEVPWTHDAYTFVIIRYGHGKKKRINDYGLISTHTFRAFHYLMMSLWTTQPWRHIRRTDDYLFIPANN